MRWWDSCPIDETTASADAAVMQRPSERALDAALESGFATVGDRYTASASTEVVCSWIRRLSHRLMASCEV